MEKKELVRFYFDTLAHDDQIMQWYRALFLASEAIILAAAYAIFNKISSSCWILVLAMGGLVLSVFAMYTCVQRGNRVDKQRSKLQEIFWDEKGNKKDPKDELVECFEIYHPSKKVVNKVPRIIFNVVIHVFIGVALIAVLGVSNTISLCYVWGVTCVYVIALSLAYLYATEILPFHKGKGG